MQHLKWWVIHLEFPPCYQKASHVTVTHSFLLRHTLASKTLARNLRKILTDNVQILNFIGFRALNYRILKCLSQEMEARYEVFLFHPEACWISKGQVLKRLFKLQREVYIFRRKC